eukprot:TRINITY_DN20625_c0_g1_i1.p1 TRINITY_DN20625_c0_g1~~TRINITY_DN20625_c0_g1_i1.p1  ORF type:complete len:156 (-),score=56.73 TRINITY_DN20625_c0_g1_i1:298-765(-)
MLRSLVGSEMCIRDRAQSNYSDAEKDLAKANKVGGPKKNEAQKAKDVALKDLTNKQEQYRVAKNQLEETKKGCLKEGLTVVLVEAKAFHDAKSASLATVMAKVDAIDTAKFDVVLPPGEKAPQQALPSSGGAQPASTPKSTETPDSPPSMGATSV